MENLNGQVPIYATRSYSFNARYDSTHFLLKSWDLVSLMLGYILGCLDVWFLKMRGLGGETCGSLFIPFTRFYLRNSFSRPKPCLVLTSGHSLVRACHAFVGMMSLRRRSPIISLRYWTQATLLRHWFRADPPPSGIWTVKPGRRERDIPSFVNLFKGIFDVEQARCTADDCIN